MIISRVKGKGYFNRPTFPMVLFQCDQFFSFFELSCVTRRQTGFAPRSYAAASQISQSKNGAAKSLPL